jgi:hypothetical protein
MMRDLFGEHDIFGLEREAAFMISDRTKRFCFDTATLEPSQTLKAGAVLGKVTATGLCLPWNPNASDGSERVIGILRDNSARCINNQAAILARMAEVDGSKIIWPPGITQSQLQEGISQLAALNIFVRNQAQYSPW